MSNGRWSRGDVIGLTGVIVTITGIIIGVATKESRCFFGLDSCASSASFQSTTQLQTAKADFRNLDQLLASGKWEEADAETWELIKKVTSKEPGAMGEKDYKNFPREELRLIDNLWVKHSNGRFGFSVQKQIWIDSGGTPGVYNSKIYEKFGYRVGWRKDGSWLHYSDITFNTTVPRGHLPVALCESGLKCWNSAWAFGWMGWDDSDRIRQDSPSWIVERRKGGRIILFSRL